MGLLQIKWLGFLRRLLLSSGNITIILEFMPTVFLPSSWTKTLYPEFWLVLKNVDVWEELWTGLRPDLSAERTHKLGTVSHSYENIDTGQSIKHRSSQLRGALTGDCDAAVTLCTHHTPSPPQCQPFRDGWHRDKWPWTRVCWLLFTQPASFILFSLFSICNNKESPAGAACSAVWRRYRRAPLTLSFSFSARVWVCTRAHLCACECVWLLYLWRDKLHFARSGDSQTASVKSPWGFSIHRSNWKSSKRCPSFASTWKTMRE